MTKLQTIEQLVRDLDPVEFDAFRAWFVHFDHQQWDRQIEQDAAAGKLDAFADEALAAFEAGLCKPL